MWCVLCWFATDTIFVLCKLFSIQNLDKLSTIITSPQGEVIIYFFLLSGYSFPWFISFNFCFVSSLWFLFNQYLALLFFIFNFHSSVNSRPIFFPVNEFFILFLVSSECLYPLVPKPPIVTLVRFLKPILFITLASRFKDSSWVKSL